MVKKKNKGKRIISIFVLVLLLGGIGWAWSIWARIYDNPPEDDDYVRDETIVDEPDKDITNVMILGVDQRDNEAGRADTIIVMSINNDTDEIAMISIPRDSRVEIPGRGLDKINHAMAFGGVNLLRATVEKLLGVPIHHYVYTNFSGFQSIVNTLGGVTLDVERRMTVGKEGDLGKVTLQPGVQKLNGLEALAYVRFRNDSENDFGRMRRQQDFLKAVADEVLQAKSLLKLPQLMEQTAKFVRTDMSITQSLNFARRAASLNFNQIETITLNGSGKMISGVSYVLLNQEFLLQTVNSYLRWNTEGAVINENHVKN
ncbi:MAG: LCP family protein [Firmicutes bacterium]|nr:LCP family protein [Bacillota bacterium]